MKQLISSKETGIGGMPTQIRDILGAARNTAYRTANFAMVQAYWNIGRLIVEEKLKG